MLSGSEEYFYLSTMSCWAEAKHLLLPCWSIRSLRCFASAQH